MVENEQYRPPGFMENVALLDSTGACNIQVVNSKKRARLEMSSQTPVRADRVRDTAKQSEVLLLKEALKSERDTLHKLYIELEEERGASMTAANEAMAMITRLQEEKATVLMEARRYRRVAEERETHNQEAISLLKEALLTKEDDLLALQDLLNVYQETLMRIESGQQGDQGIYLEEERDKEEFLLLEGPKATPSLSLESRQKQIVTGIWRTDDGDKEFECHDESPGFKYSNQVRHDGSSINFPDCFDEHEGVDERRYDGLSEEDYHTSKGQPGICGKQGNIGLKDTFRERHMCQNYVRCDEHDTEIENDRHTQEQCLEDVSESIFARVKRLEERFEYLRQNQALEYRRLNVACESDAVISDDLEPEELTRSNWEANPKVIYNRKHGYCMEPERLAADSVNGGHGEPEEILKCLSFERVRMDLRNGDPKQRSYEGTGLGHECENSGTNLHRVNDERSTSFAEVNDDGGEGVHDVYEVQYEIKRPFVLPPEQDNPIDNSGRHKCETGSMDTLMFGALQETDKELMGGVMAVPNSHALPEVCSTVDDKLSVEMSLLDVKGNLANEDVRQLQVRLQALEGERVSMKEAIDSLRKENKELKVLQELAQQLRELKVDVRRTEAPGQQDPPPLFSFFKGILSFTGLQNLATTERSRCFLHSSSCSSKQEQGGLLDILNMASKTPRSTCVTREHKVNFNNT